MPYETISLRPQETFSNTGVHSTILIRTATGYSETSIVLQLLRWHQELDVTDLDQIKEIHKWRTWNKESATIFATAK
jgi:hypothetical protein